MSRIAQNRDVAFLEATVLLDRFATTLAAYGFSRHVHASLHRKLHLTAYLMNERLVDKGRKSHGTPVSSNSSMRKFNTLLAVVLHLNELVLTNCFEYFT